ncbi:MAG: poly(R)-hydroxyalkanoic acid synthase subunit PhaE, partial [Saezia sp.]
TSWNEYTGNAMKGYQDMASSFGQAFMPAELKSLMTMPMDNASTFQNLSSEFFKPWVENSPAMQEKLVLAMQGDRKAYLEFTKLWTENYKATYSKMLNMPTLGSNRVTIEKMLKMLDQYNDFISSLNEYNVLISDSMDETMKKLLSDLSHLQKEGKQPQTFMEFFKLWSKVNETALQDLFVTDLFAKAMNDTIATGSHFKLAFDDLIQEMCSSLPFPNRKEINAVEEEVYKLRNRIKKLEKEIEAVKEAADKKPASKTK